MDRYRTAARAWSRAGSPEERAVVRAVIVAGIEESGPLLGERVRQLTLRELRLPLGFGIRGHEWNLVYAEIVRRTEEMRQRRFAAMASEAGGA